METLFDISIDGEEIAKAVSPHMNKLAALSRLNKVDGVYCEKVQLKEVKLDTMDLKGELKGTAVIFGKVDDRPLFIAQGAFNTQCGKKVPLLKGHQDGSGLDGNFVQVGSANMRCGVHRLKFDAQLNLLRDPVTRVVWIKDAGEMLALTSNGDLDGVSVGMQFTEDDVTFDKENDWIIVNKAEINELSLVVFPAINGARVSQVMSREQEKVKEVIDNSCPCADAFGAAIDSLNRSIRNA